MSSAPQALSPLKPEMVEPDVVDVVPGKKIPRAVGQFVRFPTLEGCGRSCYGCTIGVGFTFIFFRSLVGAAMAISTFGPSVRGGNN